MGRAATTGPAWAPVPVPPDAWSPPAGPSAFSSLSIVRRNPRWCFGRLLRERRGGVSGGDVFLDRPAHEFCWACSAGAARARRVRCSVAVAVAVDVWGASLMPAYCDRDGWQPFTLSRSTLSPRPSSNRILHRCASMYGWPVHSLTTRSALPSCPTPALERGRTVCPAC